MWKRLVGDRIRSYDLAGVKVDEDFKRYYPFDSTASKVLGFTGSDNQGIIGLEVYYEDYLKGLFLLETKETLYETAGYLEFFHRRNVAMYKDNPELIRAFELRKKGENRKNIKDFALKIKNKSILFYNKDFYNAKSENGLYIIPQFKTIQQTSWWSCGVSCTEMVLELNIIFIELNHS